MLSAPIVAVLVLMAGLLAAWLYETCRWILATRRLRARLNAAREPVRPAVVDFREVEALPATVRRYFRAALREGQPMVAGVRVRHRGTFNMSQTAERWTPFTSEQMVVTQRPGFDWDGRIAVLPGIPVRVHDAYVAGEGILRASLLGIVSLANLRGTGDVAAGELVRFFAEAAWYPTSLLPSQGVEWQTVDDRSANGTLTDGTIRLTMRFTFTEQGLIDSVRTEARGRTVGDKIIPTPWQGRFWNYEERGGMLVPLDGEAAWLMPEGPRAYWRGRITELVYEPAQ
jgi:hypothetical protein